MVPEGRSGSMSWRAFERTHGGVRPKDRERDTVPSPTQPDTQPPARRGRQHPDLGDPMRPADRTRVVRHIRSIVPNLHEKGRLLAATPRGRILRGVYLEDSSDPARIYVWVFVQPLYAPASTVTFDLGKRLGGPSKTWSLGATDEVATVVREEGVPFFDPVSSPEALSHWTFLDGRTDPYAREAKAYSLVASGHFSEGSQALRELARSLSGRTAWMIEMRKRTEQLADLAETNPTGAHKLLATWESKTVSALGVQDVP